MEEITRGQISALDWFVTHGTVRMFGVGDPSLTMARKLNKRGWVEIVPPTERLGFSGWRITKAGRAALLVANGPAESGASVRAISEQGNPATDTKSNGPR